MAGRLNTIEELSRRPILPSEAESFLAYIHQLRVAFRSVFMRCRSEWQKNLEKEKK